MNCQQVFSFVHVRYLFIVTEESRMFSLGPAADRHMLLIPPVNILRVWRHVQSIFCTVQCVLPRRRKRLCIENKVRSALGKKRRVLRICSALSQ